MTPNTRKIPTARPGHNTTVLSQIAGALTAYFPQDPNVNIVDAILEDHKNLKALLKIMKDPEESLERKQTAYKLFGPLLRSHTKAEEKALYALSSNLRGTELKTVEGFVEHEVADALLARIGRPVAGKGRRPLYWLAQVQVLAELVEHHLKEEESDLLPKIRRLIDAQTLAKSSKQFLRLRRSSQKVRTKRNEGVLGKTARLPLWE